MIWIDFGILCIAQENMNVPADMEDIVIEGSRRTADSEPLYNETYHFHSTDKLQGCWYTVWLPESVCYEESFFDISAKGVPWVEVVPKWTELVEKILTFYIRESPAGKIAVLLRIQDKSQNIVHADCSLGDFMQGLSAGDVRWNELYFVHS